MKKKLLAALAMALSLSACTTDGANDSKTVQDIPAKSSATESTGGAESTGEADSKTEASAPDSNLPEYATVGQIVSGETWSIALLYAKEYDSIKSEYYDQKPADGKKYLLLFFDIKNLSSRDDYFNSLYFEGYADDYSLSSSTLMIEPDGMSAVGGDLDAGKMSKGFIAYEVPTDWKKFEISYKNGLWTSHKAATFVVNKEDVASPDYTYPDSVFEAYSLDASKKTGAGAEASSDKWSVKLIDSKTYNEIGGTFAQKPDEGKQFVVFFLEAKNLSSKDDYFNTLYFRFYVDGYLTGQTLLLSDVDGYSSMSGDVAVGKMIKGYAAVQAPVGWKSVELIYDDGAFVENKVAEFSITSE